MSDIHLSNPGPLPGSGAAATTEPDAAATGATGRDNRGRFAKGNPGGRGNPFARRVAAMRQALMDAVSEEDIVVISKKMVELARDGDVAAARLVFTYVVGKPQPTEDPDRLDEKEWRQYVNETVRTGEVEAVVGGMSATLACTIAGAAVPGMQANAGQTLLADLAALDEIEKEEQAEQRAEEEAARTSPGAPSSDEETAEGTTAGGQGAPSVEDAAARVLAMLLATVGKASEPIRRAANGPDEGGNRPGPLAPPPSGSSNGQRPPKSDG